jgi:hypothetical protein
MISYSYMAGMELVRRSVMTDRELALEQALGAVVAVARQLGISMTLLAKAKADLLLQAPESEPAVREIDLAAQGSSSLPIIPLRA